MAANVIIGALCDKRANAPPVTAPKTNMNIPAHTTPGVVKLADSLSEQVASRSGRPGKAGDLNYLIGQTGKP